MSWIAACIHQLFFHIKFLHRLGTFRRSAKQKDLKAFFFFKEIGGEEVYSFILKDFWVTMNFQLQLVKVYSIYYKNKRCDLQTNVSLCLKQTETEEKIATCRELSLP